MADGRPARRGRRRDAINKKLPSRSLAADSANQQALENYFPAKLHNTSGPGI